eukprot:6492277-Amphidinium_carterae.1
MNICCWGTRFVQFVRLQTENDAPTSTASLAAFEQGWARIFGMPCTVVTDQGSEYKEPFTTKLQAEGVEHVVISSRAPWEQGITERTGGLVKQQILLGAESTDITNLEEVEQLVSYSCMARNAQLDSSGSTPSQRVFSQLPRFPADLQSDAQVDADILAMDSRGDHRRSQEIREAARVAFQKMSMATRLQRAARAQTVQQPRFSSGDLVFVMRQNALRRQWREGPGRVIAVSGASAFVAIRGELYKVATLALKKATGDEAMGVEAVQEHMPDMMAQLSRQRRVRDLTREFADAAADPPASAAPARRRLSTISTTIPEERDHDTEEPASSRRRLTVQEHVERIEQGSGTQRHGSSSSGQPPMEPPADVQGAVEASSASAPATPADGLPEGSYGPMREDPTREDRSVRSQAYWAVSWDEPHGVREQVTEDLLVMFVSACSSFMVTRRATDEVDPETLTEEDWKKFWPAMEKECHNLIAVNQGLEPLTLEESQRLRQVHSDRIIQSRYHLKWKQVDEAKGVSFVPKARLILKGFQDPDILQLPSSVPSPAMPSINIALAVIAGYGWEAFQADFTQAFLQGKEVDRFILVEQPKYGVPNLHPQQLLRLRKEVYGSVAGPSRWRE